MATISDVSRGSFLRFNNELVVVTEYEHRTPGNLRAFYQVKMRNIKSGKFVENRFRAGEAVELVRVEVKDQQYPQQAGMVYADFNLAKKLKQKFQLPKAFCDQEIQKLVLVHNGVVLANATL